MSFARKCISGWLFNSDVHVNIFLSPQKDEIEPSAISSVLRFPSYNFLSKIINNTKLNRKYIAAYFAIKDKPKNKPNNKKLIANLKNQIHSQNNEFQNLKHKIFALNHEVKGLQDQILILEEKFRNLSEDKQDHAIQEWLQSLEKNGIIQVIKHGGNN